MNDTNRLLNKINVSMCSIFNADTIKYLYVVFNCIMNVNESNLSILIILTETFCMFHYLYKLLLY